MTSDALPAPLRTGTTLRVVIRLALAWLVMPLFFFAIAGSLTWWQAWVYIGVLLVPMTVFVMWMLRADREFLERRMQLREKERTQRRILSWSAPIFIALVAVPPLDWRFGWSTVATPAVVVAQALVLVSYLGLLRVFLENRWAGRTVEVVADQKLVTTGPYAVVRHPMYSCSIVLYLATPVALGSLWGLIPALLTIAILVARIGNEEQVLLRELAGYAGYQQEVRYRLLPGVW